MATKITLAGDELEIFELPARQNKLWRERATAPLSVQRNIVKQAEANGNAVDLYQEYVGLVNDHFDTIFELVIERVPAEHKARLADLATQTEILTAFLILVREAFSTGFFWDLVAVALTSGETGPATGTNSPAPNGASGQTNLTRLNMSD